MGGSTFLKWDVLLPGLILAAFSEVLSLLLATNSLPFTVEVRHVYGMQALGTVVAFAVVFRTNLGWQRYWEAVTQLHFMYSKWQDVYAQVLSFTTVTLEKTKMKTGQDAEAKFKQLQSNSESILDKLCLMSALASDRLAHGDIVRMDRRSRKAPWSEKIMSRRGLRRGKDYTGATKFPELSVINMEASEQESSEHGYDDSPQLPAPERRTLVNRWSDAVYLVSGNVENHLRDALEKSLDRPSVLMYEVMRELAAISSDLDIAPPIQSRMYQELSNGMLGFNQSMKIADIPFPFPFAQILSLLLIFLSAFCPIFVVIFTQNSWLTPFVTFLIFEGTYGINELAKELESPFGPSPNHISLADFHTRFMESIKDMRRTNYLRMASILGDDAAASKATNSV